MSYDCKRCGYLTNKKTNLKVHLEKKNPCEPVLHDISPDILVQQLYPEIEAKLYECSCGKKYSYPSGLSAHKKSCKFKSEQIDFLEIVKNLEEKIKRLECNSPNVINNDNKVINNITNNLIINDFGKEEIDYITEKFVRTCLKQQDHGFIRLTEKIHFNDDHPENKNVVLPNKKEPYVQVVEKGKQTLKPKKEVIDDLIVNIGNILDEQLEYVIDELKKNWVKNERMANELDKFMKQVFDDNSNIRKKLTERVYLLLVNNRN